MYKGLGLGRGWRNLSLYLHATSPLQNFVIDACYDLFRYLFRDEGMAVSRVADGSLGG